jgi:ribonuclease BN (tRNA processing enzyme)
MAWALRFHGVGNSGAVALGSAMATIERDGRPWLTIDCGGEGLTAYLAHYGAMPEALFVTHTHLDHVGGFERLFGANFFATPRRDGTRLYVPAPLVPLLQQRVAGYPNMVAEGGANFWDAFRLVPVGSHFWHDGIRLEAFPVRHHWPETAYGLRLRGSLVWTGDTRPIPEMLARCLLYHYGSEAEGATLAARGHRVARPGELVVLREPSSSADESAARPA